MKLIIKICVGFLFVNSYFLVAQNVETSSVIPVEKGMLIYGGGYLPKNGYYRIERKDDTNKNYKEIAKITVPKSLSELESKTANIIKYFKHLLPLKKQDNERVYNYIQAYKTDDSLYRSEHLPIIAIATGTAFLDTNVEKDKTYHYKVTFFKDGKDVFTNEFKKVKNVVTTDLPIPKAQKTEIVNDAVYLQWIVKNKKDMALFNVYRAFFGTTDFKKIETKKGYSFSNDGLHIIAIDASTEKASLYKYYIQPVDLYGNVSEVSETIASGKLQSENITPISSLHTQELEDYKIKLSWELHKSVLTSNIQIWRSHNFDDGFVEIMNLPPGTLEFIDDLPEASENYYYFLKISGGSGQEFKSSKIAAIIKNNPKLLEAPLNVLGESIKNGIKISWYHDEPYTRGFYVYRAASNEKQFKQISNLIPVNQQTNYFYNDEDENLKAGDMYRYTVRAENDAFTFGKFSDTIHAFSGKKPKIEIPQKLKSVFRDSVVELYWDDMSEASKNLLGYKVYKKDDTTKKFKFIANDTLKAYKNYYYDRNIIAGKNYSYQISAIDLFGQESNLSFSTTIVIPKKNSVALIIPSKPLVYKSSEGVKILWNQIASNAIKSIKIYRSEGNKNSKVIKTISANDEFFIDTSTKKGNLYYYKISYILNDGNESTTSQEASVYY